MFKSADAGEIFSRRALAGTAARHRRLRPDAIDIRLSPPTSTSVSVIYACASHAAGVALTCSSPISMRASERPLGLHFFDEPLIIFRRRLLLSQMVILLLRFAIYETQRQNSLSSRSRRQSAGTRPRHDAAGARPGDSGKQSAQTRQSQKCSDDQPVLSLADRKRRTATSDQHHALASREVFQGSSWLSRRRS